MPRPELARGPVLSAMAALGIVLTVCSQAYGYHRDELYFRMLPPAWGYLDQPPLTPWLVHTFSHLIADQPWAIRIPATLCALGSLFIVVLITRELGGGRGAQGLCAWTYAFAVSPLLFGHVLLTSSVDLVVWPLVTWLVLRALLRDRPRCWLVAGAVVGASLYNKWLVTSLLIALVVGLLVVGPRRVLATRWPWLAVGVAVVVGLPNIIYQLAHGLPQLRMGAALSAANSAEVRVQMWPFLALLLGPPLVPIWLAGWYGLARRASWRPVRFIAVAFVVVLGLTFLSGTQVYYPFGLLAVLYAAGCVPAATFIARVGRGWRALMIGLLVVNALVAALIGLPVLPLSVLGRSPVPGINQLTADQVGWPAYVSEIDAAYRALPAADRARAAIIVSNYGEAGAAARYGPALGLPPVFSGHNQLFYESRPPDTAEVVVMVGGQIDHVRDLFASCRTVATLDNQVGVDNEEQGEPIAVCRGPLDAWVTLWPKFQHLD